MATAAQIRKLWAASREIGLEEDRLRDLAEQVSGSRSISRLSFAHAGEVIDHLVDLGARAGPGATKPSGRRTAPNEVKLLTGPQRREIDRLRAALGGRWEDDPYFAGACRRLLKQTHPRTAGDGARVIEMLKQRLAYEARRSGQ